MCINHTTVQGAIGYVIYDRALEEYVTIISEDGTRDYTPDINGASIFHTAMDADLSHDDTDCVVLAVTFAVMPFETN